MVGKNPIFYNLDYLSKLHNEMLSLIERIKPEFDMRKRVEIAVRNELIGEEHGKELLNSLKHKKNNKEFQICWEKIRDSWGQWFYPPQADIIYFDREILDYVVFSVRRYFPRETKIKKEMINTIYKGKEEIIVFLNKFRIDGIINGNPLVELFKCKLDGHVDNAGRLIIKIVVPIHLSVESFRRIIEKEYGEYRKRIFEGGGKELLDIPKVKWGVRSGKRNIINDRNKAIFKRYLEIKRQGLVDIDIFEMIYEELGLKNYMKNWESIKPIVLKYKKSGTKNS